MEQGDGNGDEGLETADSAPAGPRRSTFTPPSADAYERFSNAGFTSTQIPVDAPPPNPATVVTPPPGSGFPRPPQRRSLDDDILVSTLDKQGMRTGGALAAIEELQAQLRIREEEAAEFRNWESSMLAIGTPEARDVVEETRVAFTGAIQVIPSQSGSAPQLATEPEPSVSESAGRADPVFELVEPADPPRVTGAGAVRPQAPVSFAPQYGDEGNLEDTRIEGMPASAPVESPRTEPSESVIIAEHPAVVQKLLTPEASGADPTPPEQRNGHAIRLFWLWFAANSSVLSMVLGGVLLSLGMSLRQTIVAALAGVALSFLPIGLGTLASKWSGQPTMVISRAAFGLVGNVVPGVLSLVTRILWGAVLLWFFASATAQLLVASGATGGLGLDQLTIASAGTGFLLCLVVAFCGYRLLSVVQLVLSVASALLIIVLIALSWPLVDLSAALTIGDGPWTLVLTGLILVFSFVGLVWSTSAGDLARYQRPTGVGAWSMLTASFGNAVPAFVLIAYGALLAASDPERADAFATNPISALTEIVPVWFAIPLIAAVGIGLLSGVALSIYSGAFSLGSLAPLRRDLAVLLVSVLLGAAAVALALLQIELSDIFRDLGTTLAVPTAAWLGIFAADIMVRNRRFHTRSLVQRGGVYADVNWANLTLLAVASAVGYGLTTASVPWLAWQGYLLELMGIPMRSDLAQSDLGVLGAMGIALLGMILVGIQRIRRQEEARS